MGAAFSSDIAPALGTRPAERLLPRSCWRSRRCRRWRSQAAYLAGGTAPRAVGALTAAFLLALAGLLAARDVTTFLAFWELMTLVPAAAILVARRDAPVRVGGLRLSGDHASRRRGRVDRAADAGAARRDRRSRRAGRRGRRRADARRGRSARRVRHEGRVRAAALVAAARAPGRAGAPLGADVGRDDQGRAVRVDPRRVRVARARRRAGSESRCSPSGCCRRWAACCGRWCSTTSSGCWRSSSIENVGIIALGLGASLLFADAGAREWAAIAFAAALLHMANHAIFKALLFLGAGAFERAVGALELDRLGGLLRRMPWTGGAFLVGSMAIAGLPPLNGFASEWLTLQALLHLALDGPLGVALAAAVGARRPRGDGRAGAAVLRQGRRARAARAAAPARVRGGGRGPPRACAPGWWRSRGCASRSVSSPGCSCRRWPALAPGAGEHVLPGHAGLDGPGHGVAAGARRSPSRCSSPVPRSCACAAHAVPRRRRRGRAVSR